MLEEPQPISRSMVERLVAAQHPDLAGLPLAPTHPGWDNAVWRLGERLAVRLPQFASSVRLTANEQRWLPVLAPTLPLPVPAVVRRGEPSDAFPRPWSIVRWVEGESADRAPITDGDGTAAALAVFLRALHVPAPDDAPVNPPRGCGLRARSAAVAAGLARFRHRVDVARLGAVWTRAVAAPAWRGAPVWLHGDLHPANIAVRDGTLAGVLDFGDLCSGDPAHDLASAWVLLPDGAAEPFLERYGGLDEATIARARGSAVLMTLGRLGVGEAGEQGRPGGKATWAAPAEAALRRVVGG